MEGLDIMAAKEHPTRLDTTLQPDAMALDSAAWSQSCPALPPQVVLEIAGHFSRPKHLFHFAMCSKATWALLEDRLYRLDVAFELHLAQAAQTACADTALTWAARQGVVPTAERALRAIAAYGGDALCLMENLHGRNGYWLPGETRGSCRWTPPPPRTGSTAASAVKSYPPLLLAVRNGHIDVVRVLLDAGCDADLATAYANKVPPCSAHRHCVMRQNWLASPTLQPISAAIMEAERLDIAELMFERGASMRMARNLVAWAARYGRSDVMRWLLAHVRGQPLREHALWMALVADNALDNAVLLRLIDAILEFFPAPAPGPSAGSSSEAVAASAVANYDGYPYQLLTKGLVRQMRRGREAVFRGLVERGARFDVGWAFMTGLANSLLETACQRESHLHVLELMVDIQRDKPDFEAFLLRVNTLVCSPRHPFVDDAHLAYLDEEFARLGIPRPTTRAEQQFTDTTAKEGVSG